MSRPVTRAFVILVLALFLLGLVAAAASAKPVKVSPIERLGAAIAFDANLSEPAGQACADCHDPKAGFADLTRRFPVSEGVLPGVFGGRNAPTWAYTAWSPLLYFDADEEVWVGGMFWDGRATGWRLGSPLAEQAQGPFLNPLEMHNASEYEVIRDIRTAWYADLFREVFGADSLDDVYEAYDHMAFAIAAYESSRAVNTFNSRFDDFMAGNENALSAQERWGLELFNDEEKGKCALCHLTEGIESGDFADGKALFTDHTYDNLGLPANPYVWSLHGSDAADLGLGGFLEAAGYPDDVWQAEIGKFKVPTLRNVAKTAPYGHNGFFTSLYDIVHFYNTRDVEEWPAPEVPETVNTEELGDLGLSYEEELAIVAFLRTLTDRSLLPQPAHKGK
jgi:cytochrome c peroxidase